jgi:aryl-alcohol dehydrogenase-like predicted oxidoreductase
MQTALIQKLCLGSAQLGGDSYGIANSTGSLSSEQVFALLEYAASHSIASIDTAPVYGRSEEVIGAFSIATGKRFDVISKLPSSIVADPVAVEQVVSQTLTRLNIASFHGYLIHRFDDFRANPLLWNAMNHVKEHGKAERIGFSLYTTEELDLLLGGQCRDFGIIQVPYSIFDRRFEPYFQQLHQLGVEICVRSIFLQGLAFVDPGQLTGGLSKARGYLEKLRNLSVRSGISINSICLNFALQNTFVDKVIIGVDNILQLKNNIRDIGQSAQAGDVLSELSSLRIDDEDIILPTRWAKR